MLKDLLLGRNAKLVYFIGGIIMLLVLRDYWPPVGNALLALVILYLLLRLVQAPA